ncbi:MAG: hypothetical protein GXP63_01695 [DPANN group archaeon]|nr:hypothetical protein [DPANN group archaeon]
MSRRRRAEVKGETMKGTRKRMKKRMREGLREGRKGLPGSLLFVVLLLFVIPLLLTASPVSAIPVPQGIDGFVLGMDNITQAPAGTAFSIINLETGKVINGFTGMGNLPGRYSAAVQGTTGDRILITASTGQHMANRTVNLTGSMHQVNLYLNLSTWPDDGKNHARPSIAVSARNTPATDVTDQTQETGKRRVPQTMTSHAVPQIMIIDGSVASGSGIPVDAGEEAGNQDIIITNLRTGEQVTAENRKAYRGTTRHTGFRAAIRGRTGDQLTLTYQDRESSPLPFGKDQAGIVIQTETTADNDKEGKENSGRAATDRQRATGLLVTGWTTVQQEQILGDDNKRPEGKRHPLKSATFFLGLVLLISVVFSWRTPKKTETEQTKQDRP